MRCLAGSLAKMKAARTRCEIGGIGGVDHPPRQARPGQPAPAVRRASMGHISFGIAGFDPDEVKDELTKRGLNAREDTGGRGEIHTAPYQELPHHHPERLRPADQQYDGMNEGSTHGFDEGSTLVLRSTGGRPNERLGGFCVYVEIRRTTRTSRSHVEASVARRQTFGDNRF